jgi:ubiquinone biosynthesis protein COQ9
MIDTSTPRGRLIDTALTLAATRPWSEVTLLDIADAAHVPLDELRKSFGAKSQIVAGLMRAIDDTVLAKLAPRTVGQPARDTLFEVIMSRFDAMMPYKAALKSINAAGMIDTSLLMPFLNSQRWMLAAAGIDVDGPGGLVRSTGLATVYVRVFNIWVADDDVGMAKTMAALDQRLRRGERTLGAIEDTVGGVTRIARDLPGVLRSVFAGRKPRSERAPEPPAQ